MIYLTVRMAAQSGNVPLEAEMFTNTHIIQVSQRVRILTNHFHLPAFYMQDGWLWVNAPRCE